MSPRGAAGRGPESARDLALQDRGIALADGHSACASSGAWSRSERPKSRSSSRPPRPSRVTAATRPTSRWGTPRSDTSTMRHQCRPRARTAHARAGRPRREGRAGEVVRVPTRRCDDRLPDRHPELSYRQLNGPRAGACMSRMEPVPPDVVARRTASCRMRAGRGDDLGTLRYLWCVERGTSYGTYANAVGVTRQAVWLAVHGPRSARGSRSARARGGTPGRRRCAPTAARRNRRPSTAATVGTAAGKRAPRVRESALQRRARAAPAPSVVTSTWSESPTGSARLGSSAMSCGT